jgi:transposase InsO family protein
VFRQTEACRANRPRDARRAANIRFCRRSQGVGATRPWFEVEGCCCGGWRLGEVDAGGDRPGLGAVAGRAGHDGGGWRAHGREHGQTGAQKKAKIGFDYVHSLVDDHSRLAYCEIHPDEKGPTCAGFLTRAAADFADHGIDHIERVMTDNHWSYTRSRDVAAAIDSLGASHKLIKAHCPWQNGKVERLNRTLQVEWAYRQVFTTNAERSAALAPWLDYYNHQRRHSALGGLPPISRLAPT